MVCIMNLYRNELDLESLLIIHVKCQKEVYLAVLAPNVTVHYGSRRDKLTKQAGDNDPVEEDYGFPRRLRCQLNSSKTEISHTRTRTTGDTPKLGRSECAF